MGRLWRWFWLSGCWTVGYLLLVGHPAWWGWWLRVVVAVVMVVVGIWGWGGDEAVRKQVALRVKRQAGWHDYVGMVGLMLTVSSLLMLFFAAAPKVLEDAGVVLEAWVQPESSLGRKLGKQGDVHAAGTWMVDGDGRRPLPRRGEFKPGNRPEVYLRTLDALQAEEMMKHRLYVRAFSLGSYRDGVWSPADEGGEVRFEPVGDGWVEIEKREGDVWRYEVIHGSTLSPRQPLLGLQGLSRVKQAGLRREGNSFLWLPEDVEKKGYRYLAESVVTMLDDLPVSASSKQGAGDAYLQLPVGDLGERVKQLTEETIRDARGSVEALYRIRSRLQNQYAYSLSIENRNDRDPLRNFLFEEKRGHCELFATAGVLMARAAGVPARMTYGWSGGTFFESGQMFVFRAKESHAWAEVWMDGVGWTILEATPSVAFESDRVEVALPDEAVPVEVAKAGVEGEQEEALEAGRRGKEWSMTLAGGLGLAGLMLLGWSRRKSRRRVDSGGGWSSPGVMEDDYWCEFRAGLTKRGVRVRRSMTPRRLVEMAGGEELKGMDLYHYRVHYLEGERDQKEELEWLRRIRRWKTWRGGDGG